MSDKIKLTIKGKSTFLVFDFKNHCYQDYYCVSELVDSETNTLKDNDLYEKITKDKLFVLLQKMIKLDYIMKKTCEGDKKINEKYNEMLVDYGNYSEKKGNDLFDMEEID